MPAKIIEDYNNENGGGNVIDAIIGDDNEGQNLYLHIY